VRRTEVSAECLGSEIRWLLIGKYSYARGFRAHWVSAHSNLERLVADRIGFGVLKRALR